MVLFGLLHKLSLDNRFSYAASEDSDQTAWICRLIWIDIF